MALLQVRQDCKGALDEVWENVEALETTHTSLVSQVEGLADDLRQVADDVTEDLRRVDDDNGKLDAYINNMLKDMLGTLNQGRPPHLVQFHLTVLGPSCPTLAPLSSRSLSNTQSKLSEQQTNLLVKLDNTALTVVETSLKNVEASCFVYASAHSFSPHIAL